MTWSEWNHLKFYKFANNVVVISHLKLTSAVKNYMAHKYKCKTMSNLSHKYFKISSLNRFLLQKSRIFKSSCSVIRSMNHMMKEHIKSYANTSHFIFESFSPLSFMSQMPSDEQIPQHPHRAHCQREPALGGVSVVIFRTCTWLKTISILFSLLQQLHLSPIWHSKTSQLRWSLAAQ